MRWILLALCGIGSSAWPASDVAVGCNHLRIVLDPRLTPAIVERDWASGNPHREDPAVLELRGCAGQLLDHLTLAAPLARLDPVPVRGAPAPTYLVSSDLTAEAGSYNGPLTIPVEVAHDHLTPATARTADGRAEPIRLALTGKAAWKRSNSGKVEDLLAVSSQPEKPGFVTVYRRYHPTPRGWEVKVRSEPGMWESDGEFPDPSHFPSSAAAPKNRW